MTKLEQLIDDINNKNIDLLETEYEAMPSQTLRDEEHYAIFMNSRLLKTPVQHFCALAHEYGHCETGAVYRDCTPLETKARCEARANRRAVLNTIPVEEFMTTLQELDRFGELSVYSLANYFEVTEDYMRTAIETYKTIGALM